MLKSNVYSYTDKLKLNKWFKVSSLQMNVSHQVLQGIGSMFCAATKNEK